jgi:hypothetical protein
VTTFNGLLYAALIQIPIFHKSHRALISCVKRYRYTVLEVLNCRSQERVCAEVEEKVELGFF